MNQNSNASFEKEYMPFCIKYGRLINLLMVPAMFLPVVGLMIFKGAEIDTAAAVSGGMAYLMYNLPYFFSEPIALGPVLGVPGTYMGFAAGNTVNVCAVATSAGLEASGAQQGTQKGTVMSTLAVSTAVAMKAVMVLLLSLLGGWVLSVVPQAVLDCLAFLLPAIYGVLWVQFASTDYRMGGILFGCACLFHFMLNAGMFSFIPFWDSWTNTLVMVIIGVFLGRALYTRDAKKAGADKAKSDN